MQWWWGCMCSGAPLSCQVWIETFSEKIVKTLRYLHVLAGIGFQEM